MQTYGELAFSLRTFWHIFGGAVLQVSVSAQTSGDGGLNLKLVFPAGLFCNSPQKVALLGIALDSYCTTNMLSSILLVFSTKHHLTLVLIKVTAVSLDCEILSSFAFKVLAKRKLCSSPRFKTY